MSREVRSANLDSATVAGFGREWSAYDQTELSDDELGQLFEGYFSIFPFADLPDSAEGFDLGCGSGRWAALVAPRVGKLHCIDASQQALEVSRLRLAHLPNVQLHCASVEAIPLPDESQDFGYSLGVLHHLPETAQGLRDCVRKLKPGAPFLLYLYYALDNRPLPFRMLWRASNAGRKIISKLPFGLRKWTTTAIAALVYWPLVKSAKALEKSGANVSNLPLSFYRNSSFYTMRTDALDRFGTKLEKRFTRAEIVAMMEGAGLREIKFSEREPYWVACGRKA